jgi:hypothetical protein
MASVEFIGKGGSMKTITLTQNQVAIIDDEDFERVGSILWRAQKGSKTWYAINSNIGYLHRYIMNAPEGMEIDHKDKNGLNCTRDNMRLATVQQNRQYAEMPQTENGSGFRGVIQSRGLWLASITQHKRRKFLGRFETKEEAALAYDRAARELHGEFAVLNFPENMT